MNKIAWFLLIAAAVFITACSSEITFEDTCSNVNRTVDRNFCYVDLAISLNLTLPCDSIENNEGLRNSCYAETNIAAVDRLGCHDIKDARVRGYCLTKVATVRGELPICNNIDDADWKDVCFAAIADVTNKSEICNSIQREIASDECFDTLARKIGYAADCVFINDRNTRDRCFLAVSVSIKNSDLCNEISDVGLEWSCFDNLARIKNNSKICDLINNEAAAETCKLDFN